MKTIGTDFLSAEVQQTGYFLKAILNDNGIAFFPGKTEHRTVKFDGLSYEDDYKGNALAAIITNRRIAIRNHRDFSAGRVGMLMNSLQKIPSWHASRNFQCSTRERYSSEVVAP